MKICGLAVALVAFLLLMSACETKRGQAVEDLHRPSPQDAANALAVERMVESLVSIEALTRGVPGVAVAIVHNGKIILKRGYGIADVTSSRKVTENTPFNIASVTKLFTAAVVLKLATERLVDLDAPASKYVDLPAIYQTITVRQLLNHTSGIARDLRKDNDDDPDAEEYRRRLNASQRSSPAGSRFEYSNTGYTVLGWLIEKVETRSLEDVMRRRIFEPLGMRHARYRASLTADPERARPHVVVGSDVQPALFVSGGFGSGGMSMSIADLAAFAVGLQENRFLSQKELETAWLPGRLSDGGTASVRLNTDADGYGCGWFITKFFGRKLMTHGGAITGFSANLYHFPEERVTIGVLANVKGRDDRTAPVDPLARRIAEYYLPLAGQSPNRTGIN